MFGKEKQASGVNMVGSNSRQPKHTNQHQPSKTIPGVKGKGGRNNLVTSPS